MATVVLAVGIAGGVAAFGAMSRATGLAAQREEAALLAERRLAEIEAEGSTALAAETGDFGEEYPDYTWEQEVLPTAFEGVSELQLTVRWGSGEARRSLVVSTYVLQEPAAQTAAR